MKDLRIVIVSWNVEKLLEKCLLSLPAACEGLSWECVVVDNASRDASVEVVHRVGATSTSPGSIMPIRVIANSKNLGFAKACNIGAKDSDTRYVLFLNPDTECPPGSLAKLVAVADANPKAGILGPKITNPDGTYQESIRRFPTIWDQAGIMLKLHHLFPWLKTFRNYFAKDFDSNREQAVDQVMGACFLVRRELIDQKLGFDERYFIWFEEVDFCKTAIQHGWEVRYVPSVSIVHHGGTSFAQVFTPKKQRYLDESLKKYFLKWHPKWQSILIGTLHPIAMFQAYVIGALRTSYGKWVCVILGIEIVSAATIFTSLPNTLATLFCALVMFVLAWKRPTIALAVLLLELLIGSKGYLLQLGGWPSPLSLRIVVTAAFCAGWCINWWQHGRVMELVRLFEGRRAYLVLCVVIAYASLRGSALGNPMEFADANAWADWFLLFPVLDISWRYRETIRRDVIPVMICGIAWLGMKMLALEYVFAHGFASVGSAIYLWIRRTGVGEITLVAPDAYRVFFQSAVFAVPAWIASVAALLNTKRIPLSVITISTMILGISLSRSVWIGAGVGGIVLMFLLLKQRAFAWKRLWWILAAKIVALICIAAALMIPIPHSTDAKVWELFVSRTSASEPAALSRWQLLPILWDKVMEHPVLGSGFGATVTYESRDPRVLAAHPDGMYTTYAFEWGWMDHWIKFGLIGIPLMVYLLFSLGKRLWRLQEPLWLRVSAVSTLIALAALHVFTPYLNHPLGFVFFFVGEGMILSSRYVQSRTGAQRAFQENN